MSGQNTSILFWAPRLLAIAFAGFLSIFALDVFGEGRGFWDTLLAFLLHLAPAFLVLTALAVAWRWERFGALFFLGLALLYFAQSWGRLHWTAYALIGGPLILVSLLFWWGGTKRAA